MGKLIEWAVHNRRTMYLLFTVLVAAGVYSMIVMPKQEMPVYTIKQGVIIGVYPSANSLEVEQQLTKPLEKYLFTFPEVKRKKTHSKTKDGIAYVFVDLEDNVKDKNVAWSKIKHGIELFKQTLPAGVLAVIANDNFADVASILITLESDDKTYRELDGYLDRLEDRLRIIPSVANTHRYGSQKEQITLYLDNDKLNAYGIGSKLLMVNLFGQSFTLSSGTMDNDRMVAPVHIAASYHSEYDIAEQIIYSDPLGNVVRVKDIARVVREYPDPESYITNNGKRCILLSIEVRPDVNIVTFGKEVNSLLETFQSELPESVGTYRIVDQPKIVNDAVNDFLRQLLMAIVSVILTMMLLWPLRLSIVTAASIPISVAISIAIMFIGGIPLNMVSLAALIVVLGMLTDNSVVIVDGYVDKIDRGIPRKQASIDSAKEYLMSIFSATLTISITFFPFLLLVEGEMGEFIKPFPWTVFIALFTSLIVAITIIPLMQYLIIRKGIVQEKEERQKRNRKERRSILDVVQGAYDKMLGVAFACPKMTMGLAFASIAGGFLLMMVVPVRMMPNAVRDQFAVEIYLPQGSPLEKTAAICDSMEAILQRDPRVVAVTAFVGEGSPRFHLAYAPQMPSKSFGQFIVNTISNEATETLLDEFADRYACYVPEAYVRFKQLDFQAYEAPIEVRLIGEDLGELKQQAGILTDYLHTLDECMRVRTSLEEPLAGAKIELNPMEAGRLGIQRTMVAMGIASGLTGSGVTTLWEGEYAMPVRIQPENTNPDFADVGDVQVSGLYGATVPLRQVAEITPEWNEGQITHRNGLRMLTVLSEVKRGVNANDVYKKIYHFMDERLIPQMPADMKYEYGGLPELEWEGMEPMMKAIAVALIMIFMILVFHTGKVSRATLIISSVTLGVIGMAIGTLVMGIEFGSMSMMGIVGLASIIVRNGIIMFDYLEKIRKEQGLSVREAAFEAGKRRMRPIFVTSTTTAIGVLPMIISNDPSWTPLGTVIFFGTLISMVLIVFILPVVYWLIFRHSGE